MKFRPLYDRLLVKRAESRDVTEGGLFIPQQAQEKMLHGEVLAAGAGTLKDDGSLRPLSVKVGDVIIFDKYAGTDIEMNGETFLILSESEVLGISD